MFSNSIEIDVDIYYGHVSKMALRLSSASERITQWGVDICGLFSITYVWHLHIWVMNLW